MSSTLLNVADLASGEYHFQILVIIRFLLWELDDLLRLAEGRDHLIGSLPQRNRRRRRGGLIYRRRRRRDVRKRSLSGGCRFRYGRSCRWSSCRGRRSLLPLLAPIGLLRILRILHRLYLKHLRYQLVDLILRRSLGQRKPKSSL